jgi:hypothetical protein
MSRKRGIGKSWQRARDGTGELEYWGIKYIEPGIL